MNEDGPVVDRSLVEGYLRSRHRIEVYDSAWRPVLAGSAGALAIIGAVALGAWLVGPRYRYNEVTIPQVSYAPVEVPKVTTGPTVTVPTITLKPIDIPVPRVVEAPPRARDIGPRAPYAAKTPEENKFVDKPEYKNATYHGRIVKSRDGHELSFEDGMDFHPAHWDTATGKMVYDTDAVILSDTFIGDLGMCTPEKGHDGMWDCVAMHGGIETLLGGRQSINTSATPTTAAANMVAVDIQVGGYPVEAMVDTGCAWPMAVPKIYADALVRAGLATRAGSSSTTFADGSTHDVGVIMISAITVEGRVLHDVEASVSLSNEAPVLLGLGALNRLGPYTITDGKLVFTGGRPA